MSSVLESVNCWPEHNGSYSMSEKRNNNGFCAACAFVNEQRQEDKNKKWQQWAMYKEGSQTWWAE